jgi:hypothetical protein
MRGWLGCILAMCGFLAPAWAQTPLPALRGKVVLRAAKSPYIQTVNAVLGALDTLVVEPGVVVRVKGYVRLDLRGVVEIRGTEKKPVRFQSVDSLDSWVGIHFATGARTFIAENLIVENAFRNTVTSASGIFVNSQFVNNYYGLWVDASPLLQLSGCQFTRNRYALSVGSGPVKLDKSHLTGNVYGLYLEKGARIVGDLAQASGNAEADVRDEAAELAGKKNKLSRNLWRKVEAGF